MATFHGLWYAALLHQRVGHVVASNCAAGLEAVGGLSSGHTHTQSAVTSLADPRRIPAAKIALG